MTTAEIRCANGLLDELDELFEIERALDDIDLHETRLTIKTEDFNSNLIAVFGIDKLNPAIIALKELANNEIEARKKKLKDLGGDI